MRLVVLAVVVALVAVACESIRGPDEATETPATLPTTPPTPVESTTSPEMTTTAGGGTRPIAVRWRGWTINGVVTRDVRVGPWFCWGPEFLQIREDAFGVQLVFLRADTDLVYFIPGTPEELEAAEVYRSDVELPVEAMFSGIATQAVELWFLPGDETAAYLVFTGGKGPRRVELWPSMPYPLLCE